MKGFIFLGLCVSPFYFAQQSLRDSLKTSDISEITLLKKLPVTKEIISVKNLENKNLGQDLPILLKNFTSVETTSDAGNGIGYTGIKIRGVDGTRINVMLNGVPYNDSESQGSFFVNLPDVTSTASQIVIQRGVGTSTNGVAAFGASVNILSQDPSDKAYFSTQNSFGSFNSHKHSFEMASGSLLDGKLSITGRYSIIKSDGYIDRAFSDLSSYNLVALYKKGNTRLRFLTFGGKEKTYQAWNGISKKQYENNPTYNASGEIYDTAGQIIGFYNDETDNYQQQHYQFLWEQKFDAKWKMTTTFHYTKGKGFYNNYKSNQKLSKYGLPNITIGGQTIARADLIRKKWLDNDFYGVVSELQGKLNNLDLNFGLVANQYEGKHFGEITSGSYLQQIQLPWEYYRNHGVKNEISSYAKALYQVDKWELFGDVQLRNIQYTSRVDKASPEEAPVFDRKYSFFNPKIGASYFVNGGKIYFSYANANREPVRSDLVENPDVKPEQLHDFELGYNKSWEKLNLSVNFYYMLYKNQLVLTGKINDVGAAIHENVGKSYRTGLEINANYKWNEKWNILGNASFSKNINQDFLVETDQGTLNLGNTAIAFSPNFIGNMSVNYNPTEKIALTWVNKLVGKQYINNTENDNFLLKSYYLSDFMASYKTHWNKTEIGIFALVNNFLNTKYTNYGVDYGEPFYYAQARANFMIGLNVKFK